MRPMDPCYSGRVGTEPPIVRSILAVPGLVLRRDWLRSHLRERPMLQVAGDLNALCESAEALVASSREALVAWVAVLVNDAESAWTQELRRLAHETNLHGLLRLMRTYSIPSAFDSLKVDDHNPALGRELTVGERRSLARKAHRSKFDRLLLDPHPLVLRQLLGNPKLTENDVVSLAAQRPARAATMKTLAGFPDWFVRARIRMAIISNPLTPSSFAVPLTALATRPELVEISNNPGLHVVLRAVALELLERHPPLGPADSSTLQ
jgi:hypothetical protein